MGARGRATPSLPSMDMTERPKEWDPAPQEREWFRQSSSGNLGWLVRREGTDRIKLDRAGEDIVVPYWQGEWIPENERRPMTIAQIAEICFVADRRLITYTHNPGLQKNWADLKDEDKIEWMEKGPRKDRMRAKLYRLIMDGMAEYYR